MQCKRVVSITIFLLFVSTPFTSAYRKTTEMVPMADGTLLATDIYWPDQGNGPWHTFLVRTPYDKSRYEDWETASTGLGFAVVVQDARGRFDSEGGEDGIWFDDGWTGNRDGYDTIEWIAAQSWSSGKVETHGYSAMGITQAMTAGAAPPHLVCQWIGMAGPSLYHYFMFFGGVFRASDIENYLEWQDRQDFIDEIVMHPDYGPFWEPVNAETREAEIKAPCVHVGGWFDYMIQGPINNFAGRQYNGGEGARGNQLLIMGPWMHEGMESLDQAELSFPPNSRYSSQFSDLRRDWVYYWLEDEATGVMDQPPVHYYVMGDVDDPESRGNEWRSAERWPVTDVAAPLYLHGDGSLTWFEPAVADAARTFIYDPEDPVPTLGGGNLAILAGPRDQRTVENRSDVLIYETEVLTEPMEVVGQIYVRLFLSSDCPDTDLTAKLTDVYPDGRSMLILDGALRVRHRQGLDREDFMIPGEVVECEVDLWSTALCFNRGHRLRLAVSSSNYPRFDPNPNTGHAFRSDNEVRVARNTIHNSSEYPSCLMLPLTYPKPLGVQLELNRTIFHPGESFQLDGFLNNPSSTSLSDTPLFIMLDVYGEFFFWPSWRHFNPSNPDTIDFEYLSVPPGSTQVDLFPSFIWPDTGDAAVDNLAFYAAMLNQNFSSILGESAVVIWGFGP